MLSLLAIVTSPGGPVASEPAVTLSAATAVPAVADDELPATGVAASLSRASLGLGASGPAVLAVEQRLAELNYLIGDVDTEFDHGTRHGLYAFQKVEGLELTGFADGPTLARLWSASTPRPRYTSPGNHLEVDIARQVVFVVRSGEVAAILPTSTGSGRYYTNQGRTRRAVTPNGRFTVSRKINGMRIAPLGQLYKPSYFNGGIAFHGNPSVPPHPASHGCVRLPMGFSEWFFAEAAPVGQVVYVHSGPSGKDPLPGIDPV